MQKVSIQMVLSSNMVSVFFGFGILHAHENGAAESIPTLVVLMIATQMLIYFWLKHAKHQC